MGFFLATKQYIKLKVILRTRHYCPLCCSKLLPGKATQILHCSVCDYILKYVYDDFDIWRIETYHIDIFKVISEPKFGKHYLYIYQDSKYLLSFPYFDVCYRTKDRLIKKLSMIKLMLK